MRGEAILLADGFSVDASEFRRLGANLGKIPAKATREVEAVLKKGAVNIKREMQAAFEGSPHFRGVARHVSFDRKGLGFEVGPTQGGAGSLAGIAVDGGANGGGGSVDIDSLLPAEAAAVERFIGDVLDGLL